MVVIGILNLQGAVSEHYDISEKSLKKLGISGEVKEVRYSDDVKGCDGIIISGGESTVIGKLIAKRGIDKAIIDNKIPVLGTCAGMVLLAKKTDFKQDLLGLMDIEVKRNAYGRQVNSFEKNINIFDKDFLGVFIRAPGLKSYDESKEDIEVLSVYDDEIIAIKQGRNIAISFHPELTDDTLIHEYFIGEVLKCAE
ncbi:pyridoxal 5'-phosphate synthase glutaminase subunit PdxT [Methanobrevibacter sp. DSM 116169]|uniref:pyridoxal 5'-phosphate synthase glutaminase subunit PdxT n=1 Tax=Methanobrevibacter sp. DSM 116169 TaxID=3242727 RepID=UPI0038FC9CAE